MQQLPGYGLDVDEWVDEEEFVPRYNIAPRTQAPVIRHRDPDSNGSPLIMQTMKWGLVPHWSKFEDKSLNTTNARSENLIEGGGMWASLKGKKRCAIPCQGYIYLVACIDFDSILLSILAIMSGLRRGKKNFLISLNAKMANYCSWRGFMTALSWKAYTTFLPPLIGNDMITLHQAKRFGHSPSSRLTQTRNFLGCMIVSLCS